MIGSAKDFLGYNEKVREAPDEKQRRFLVDSFYNHIMGQTAHYPHIGLHAFCAQIIYDHGNRKQQQKYNRAINGVVVLGLNDGTKTFNDVAKEATDEKIKEKINKILRYSYNYH